MSDEEWSSPFVRCIGVLLSGDTIDVLSFEGEPIRDETFLFLINAHFEPIAFVLPGQEHLEWMLLLDTAEDHGFLPEPIKFASGDDVEVIGRGVNAETGVGRESAARTRPEETPGELKRAKPRGRGRPPRKKRRSAGRGKYQPRFSISTDRSRFNELPCRLEGTFRHLGRDRGGASHSECKGGTNLPVFAERRCRDGRR